MFSSVFLQLLLMPQTQLPHMRERLTAVIIGLNSDKN